MIPPHPPPTALPVQALLLIGPTGSGKTPLGERLESARPGGVRWAHFDFGAALRRAARTRPASLSPGEHAVVTDVLRRGALLEDAQFEIAAKVLCDFIAERKLEPQDWLVLNGLPRHAGQAAQLDPFAAVRGIVHLVCTPEAVFRRIAADTGGDRAGRPDDAVSDITRRLHLFEARTLPLLDLYRRRGVSILEVPVDERSDPDSVFAAVIARIPGV